MAFATLAAISAMWSLDPSRSYKAGLVLAAYVGVAVLIISYIASLSHSQRDRIWTALVAGAIIALIELTTIEIYSVVTRWDAARTFHKISFYGLLAAAVLLHPQTNEARKWKVFLLTFFAIPTLLIGKTTGVNLLILATVALYLLPAQQLPKLLFAVFSLYCLLALLSPFLADRIFDWADQSSVSHVKSVASFMGRLDLWRLMAPYILEHPWFGHGADTVRVSEFIVQHVKYYDLPDIPSAHNMIFDQWYELGLVGIISLLAILGMTLRDISVSACRYNLAAAVIFLGFIVEFSVDHRLWLSWVQGTAVFAASVLVSMALRTPRQNYLR
jgi:O-antigen ligase